MFSIIRKNQNGFRPNLDTKTLEALLLKKTKNVAHGEACFKKKFSKKDLEAAKAATKQALSN